METTLSATTGVLVEKPRISSIDTMRGLVMVIMALDHVRDFFHLGALTSDPTNLATTTPAIFFTRFITHYCAPTFVFLAGTSIFISAQRKTKKELAQFLVTRGLWLILLEVVVVRFGILFNFYYDITFFQVIWVIGASMIVMAALTYLPYTGVLITGLTLVFLHNIFDAFPVSPENKLYGIWTVLRQSGFVQLTDSNAIFVIYPLLPWLGIMALGYCLGKLYRKEFPIERRRKLLFQLGLAATILFIVLRTINVYGDPAPWSAQNNFIFSLISFLNVTKYPVSLLYTLVTLGPVLMILSVMDRYNWSALKPLTVFGRVPLFYYVLHFYLIHFVSLLFFMNKTGKSLSDIDFHFNQSFGGITAEGGYSLTIAYVVWVLIVLSLYPLCKWYDRYKSTHKHWWLSYL